MIAGLLYAVGRCVAHTDVPPGEAEGIRVTQIPSANEPPPTIGNPIAKGLSSIWDEPPGPLEPAQRSLRLFAGAVMPRFSATRERLWLAFRERRLPGCSLISAFLEVTQCIRNPHHKTLAQCGFSIFKTGSRGKSHIKVCVSVDSR
jgi:hypothetical protein